MAANIIPNTPDIELCTPHGNGWRPAVFFQGRFHIWAGEYQTAEAAIGVARSLLDNAQKNGWMA